MRTLLPLCALFCGLLPGLAQAQIYKSVDARGRTLYSDEPPPAAAQSSTVRMMAPPMAIQAPANWELREYEAARRMPAPPAPVATDDYAANAAASRACNSARAKLQELARIEGRRAYQLDARGERVYLGDEERGAIENDAQQSAAAYADRLPRPSSPSITDGYNTRLACPL